MTIGLFGIAALLVMLLLRIPVAFAMFLTGFLGIWHLNGWNAAMGLLASETFTLASNPELVIVPLFIPACKALGIDLVHFGVLVVVNSMIGLITPPYGILLFVINAVTGIKLRDIISEIWAFLGVLILALIVLILFPDLVLFLPRLFGYAG